MKKGCELCAGVARMYCESDQASLCWDCDEKVHGANFLVAKHCRTLLCQVCQSPTPWKASGPKLSPTVSICQSCVSVHNCNISEESQENDVTGYDLMDDDGDSDDSEEDDDAEEEVDEEEEDGDNQVVPWSSTAVSSPMPPTASSSSSEEEISDRFSGEGRGLKRRREINADLGSDNEMECFLSRFDYGSSCERLSNEENKGGGEFRPLKQARRSEIEEDHLNHDDGQEESRRSTATIDSIKRLQRGIDMIPSPKSPQGQGAAMEVNPTKPRTRSQGPSNEDAATALMSLIVHALRGDQHHTEDEDIAEPSKTAWKVCIHANEATKAPAGRGPRTHGNGGPDRKDARARAMHEDNRTTRAARMISKARSAHMGEGRDQHSARVTNGTARVKTQQVISTFNPVHNYGVPSTQVIHPVLSTQDIFPVSSTQETPHHNSTE